MYKVSGNDVDMAERQHNSRGCWKIDLVPVFYRKSRCFIGNRDIL